MATITNFDIVQEIMDKEGYYPGDDIPVVRIVEYSNQFNGDRAWGLIYRGENLDRYHTSPACINPHTIWEKPLEFSEGV
jgi:hypothetical protein